MPFDDPVVVPCGVAPFDDEEPALRPFAPAPGDGDFDFFALTACPVITKSLLLTDLSPLYPKTGVFLATVVGAWYSLPSGMLLQEKNNCIATKPEVVLAC